MAPVSCPSFQVVPLLLLLFIFSPISSPSLFCSFLLFSISLVPTVSFPFLILFWSCFSSFSFGFPSFSFAPILSLLFLTLYPSLLLFFHLFTNSFARVSSLFVFPFFFFCSCFRPSCSFGFTSSQSFYFVSHSYPFVLLTFVPSFLLVYLLPIMFFCFYFFHFFLFCFLFFIFFSLASASYPFPSFFYCLLYSLLLYYILNSSLMFLIFRLFGLADPETGRPTKQSIFVYYLISEHASLYMGWFY